MATFIGFPEIPKAIPIHHSSLATTNRLVSLFDISNLNPLASGNKLFKLTPNINYAQKEGFKQILSFGGAFSNHIHALAAFGYAHGLQTIGIIRGEPEYANNPTLTDALKYGMQLEFIDRKTYRLRHDRQFIQQLTIKYPNTYILPEGGTNQLALEACIQLARKINQSELPTPIDTITVACGSGGTLAGLTCGLNPDQQALGFSAVKDTSLGNKIDKLIKNRHHQPYQLIYADYGGFAKIDNEHLDFILDWLDQTGILLDPVYTSKMCRRLIEIIDNDKPDSALRKAQHIGIIHTGGLQAWFGMKDRINQLQGKQSWKKIKQALACSYLPPCDPK